MGAGSWRQALTPSADDVPSEYWAKRRLDWLLALLTVARQGLSAQGWLLAIGVGKANASLLTAVTIVELNSVVGRCLGLLLSSWVSTAYIASRARLFVAIEYILAPCLGIFTILLLAAPAQVAAITLLATILTAGKQVVSVPAIKALWAHMQVSADPRKRAEVNRKNANQDRVVKLLGMASKYAVLLWAGVHTGRITVLWTALTACIVAANLVKLSHAVPPTLNAARLGIALAAWHAGDGLLSPRRVAAAEVVWKGCSLRALCCRRKRRRGWRFDAVMFGVGAEELLRCGVGEEGQAAAAASALATAASSLLAMHAHEQYVLGADLHTQRVTVALRPSATPHDQLRAGCHAYRLCEELRRQQEAVEEGDASYSRVKKLVQLVHSTMDTDDTAACLFLLQARGFHTHSALLTPGPWRLQLKGVNASSIWQVQGSNSTSQRCALVDAQHARRWMLAGNTSVPAWVVTGEHNQRRRRWLQALYAGTANWLRGVLLPAGYPGTVAPEYLRYQLFDTLQAMCSDLRAGVTMQAAMVGAGVGNAAATVKGTMSVDIVVALLQQVVGFSVGSTCRADLSAATMKTWRVYDTMLSVAAACFTLLEGAFPVHRLGIKCAATTLASSVSPLAGGARSALILHLANDSVDTAFVADVGAKETNQDRVLGLVLVALRYGLLLWVGLHWARAWAVIAVLSTLHVAFNALAARSLALRKLNLQRAELLLEGWQSRGLDAMATPAAVARQESIVPLWAARWCWRGGQQARAWRVREMQVGVTQTQLLMGLQQGSNKQATATRLMQVHAGDAYVLGGHTARRRFLVVLRQGATEADQLRAAVHAWMARDMLLRRGDEVDAEALVASIAAAHKRLPRVWQRFSREAAQRGWRLDKALFQAGRHRDERSSAAWKEKKD